MRGCDCRGPARGGRDRHPLPDRNASRRGISAACATVYVHTNDEQYIGALVAQHPMRRNSRHADRFHVQILHTRDHDFLRRRHGQEYPHRLLLALDRKSSVLTADRVWAELRPPIDIRLIR
jgi:hypothetical protein